MSDMTDSSLLEKLPLLSERKPIAYGISIAVSLAAGILRGLLDPLFPPGFPFLTFFPAVIICSFLFGRGPGILCAIVCGLMAWYFFISPFDSFSMPTTTSVALLFYIGVVAVDIALVHWMQRANRRLIQERQRSGALAERNELLFKELQHRVSNNIQMVGAVLSLQKRGITDPTARQLLDDAVGKLNLIGRIQRQLYDMAGSPVALDAFIDQLVRDIAEASAKPGITYRVDAHADISIDPDQLIPFALILAEGVANALEHGFADREIGHIAIEVRHHDNELTLRVTDDGIGLPVEFKQEDATSLGLKIARSLAAQLGGRFSLSWGDSGTVALLVVPIMR